MKFYYGTIIGNDDDRVVTVGEDGKSRRLDLRLDLRNHSPTGFSWGYGGSGPAQLALAICADVYGDKVGSNPMVYGRLQTAILAQLDMNAPFTIDEEQVRRVIGQV